MVLFGISAWTTTSPASSPSPLRAFVGLLALSSKTSLSSCKTTRLLSSQSNSNNGQRDPTDIPDGWDDLLNANICNVLERQSFFEGLYSELGQPSWKLDLQPSGACVLEFTSTGSEATTVAKYACRLVGSESNTAGTFLWAIPPDPTMGLPHALAGNAAISPDVQSAIFQTREEIALSATVNGYSIALMAAALLDEPAKAVFLGPYGDDTGTLYLLITDTETYPPVEDKRPKMERLKGFVNMAAEIPFITNHKDAFTAYASDLGLSLKSSSGSSSDDTTTESSTDETVTVTDVAANESLQAHFDSKDHRLKRLGDLVLMTTEELEAAKVAQTQQQQQQQPPQGVPQGGPGNPNNKCAQLQMQFFQKVMDESFSNQRQLFLEVATALELTLSDNPTSAKEIEAWDPSTGEAAVGVFDAENRMTQWRNVKKTA